MPRSHAAIDLESRTCTEAVPATSEMLHRAPAQRFFAWAWLVLLALLIPILAAAEQSDPVLRYDPPPNWYRGASVKPQQYSSNEANAGIQIYAFRPIDGDIEQLMQRDLLRSWIDPRFQESNLVGPPAWGRSTIPGADVVYSIHFGENVVGIVHEHVRLVIVAHAAAAIVDASAGAPESWQRASPAMEAMYQTLRVETAAAEPTRPLAAPSVAGREIAGLYMGSRMRYMADLQGGSPFGKTVAALHFYLLSVDGHFYRFYDVPLGDLTQFDFSGAAREDPENSGSYTVARGMLTLYVGGPEPQTLITPIPNGGRLEVEGVVYLRQ